MQVQTKKPIEVHSSSWQTRWQLTIDRLLRPLALLARCLIRTTRSLKACWRFLMVLATWLTASFKRLTSAIETNSQSTSDRFWEVALKKEPSLPSRGECLQLKRMFQSEDYKLYLNVLLFLRAKALRELETLDPSNVQLAQGRAAMLRTIQGLPEEVESILKTYEEQDKRADHTRRERDEHAARIIQ